MQGLHHITKKTKVMKETMLTGLAVFAFMRQNLHLTKL